VWREYHPAQDLLAAPRSRFAQYFFETAYCNTGFVKIGDEDGGVWMVVDET